MPTYDFYCSFCDKEFEVISSIKAYESVQKCEGCQRVADRVWSPNIQFIGLKVQDAKYNQGLGCVVKSKYHQSELCKQKNVEEIGNDYKSGRSMDNTFEAARKEKARQRWEQD
jgi:putative FmdB family regulatory protein